MTGWVFPIGFWFLGTLIAASPNFLFHFVERQKENLFNIEEKVISLLSWWWFTLICSILSVILIVAGFIALSFVLVA